MTFATLQVNRLLLWGRSCFFLLVFYDNEDEDENNDKSNDNESVSLSHSLFVRLYFSSSPLPSSLPPMLTPSLPSSLSLSPFLSLLFGPFHIYFLQCYAIPFSLSTSCLLFRFSQSFCSSLLSIFCYYAFTSSVAYSDSSYFLVFVFSPFYPSFCLP